ncbi:hypothetical protein B0J18DRAFT_404344 [Chaetomium sp. MPI-SDFR-AT-0129]|nr:hypothetical protein B0J18DRAFT_404344 [Chaetomium sp. MPI-SDFR-AT-0129]
MAPSGIKKPTLPPHLLKELGATDFKPNQKRRGRNDTVSSRKDRRKAERQLSRTNRSTAGRNQFAAQAAPNRGKNASHRAGKPGPGKPVSATAGPKSILKPQRSKLNREEDEKAPTFEGLDETDEDDESGSEDGFSWGGDIGEDSGDDGEGTEEADDDEGEDAPTQRKVSKSVKDKLAQDDADIADLERRLGLKNRKSLPQSFKDDGLGDLLDGLGGSFDGENQEKRKRKAEADDWLAQKRRRAEAAIAERSRPTPAAAGSDDDEVSLGESDQDTDDLDEGDAEGGWPGLGGLDDEDLDENEQGGSQDGSEPYYSGDDDLQEDIPQKPVRENPYVAPTSQPAAKYVPPSLRKESGSDNELAARIRRQTQGLVNRITESNLLSILDGVEKLYRENPRQHVTSALVDLLLIQICDPTTLPDTLLILSAGFATAAYTVLGTDFGGQLITEVVGRFEKHYEEAKVAALDRPDVSKQTSNLITFISQLYTFQLIGPNIIFDYIRMLLDSLSELNAELLLRIVRMCGSTLRQDDPMALKDIVSLIPAAVAKAGEKNLTVRTKFMIDTITDLKNNKLKAGAGASAVVSEHTTRMKKLLGQLKSRRVKNTEPMRIGLKDIQDADKKGKWWLVGASWTGGPAAQKGPEAAGGAEDRDSDDESILLDDVEQGPDLGELAREQGMNTGVRRSIFVSIMSAMDYQDAYLRILKLRLNKERQREIPNVIIQCVGAEQHYNPYYTLVAKRLCAEQREVRWSFQSSLWKMFGRMGEPGFGGDEGDYEEEDEPMDMRRVVNTAKMFGALIAGNNLGVIVLKHLNLLYLQKKTQDFVEIMLVNVLLECQLHERPEEAIAKVFGGVDAAPDLARGLQYFLHKVVRKSDLAGGKKNTKLLKERCKMAEAVVQAALAGGEDLA